ncbi:MAG: polysaccharide biosynthesis/export family protein [Ketobacteraceae bacterium]|nr:polysaccharide biosynthesis/export family protein [Ketobacteraceae bacterium]
MNRVFLVLLCCILASCGTLPRKENFTVPLQHFGAQKGTAEVDNDYKLQPDDVLDVLYHFDTITEGVYLIAPHDRLSVKFLNASEYDDIHQVRPDGFISLPFVGDVKAAGKSVNELKNTLTRMYRPILKDPSFFVSLVEYQVHLKEIRSSLDHPNMGQARLITVRGDSKISLPMVGELDVKNKSIAEVRAEANERYAKVASGMSVDVLLQKSHPRQVYIFGEVRNPGGHQVTGAVSLFQAVAMAGGPSNEAELSTVVAMTRENDEIVAQVYDFEDVLNGKSKAFTAMLSPEDMVYIPRNRLSSTAQVMRSVSEILLFRGIGLTYSYRLDDNRTEFVDQQQQQP